VNDEIGRIYPRFVKNMGSTLYLASEIIKQEAGFEMT